MSDLELSPFDCPCFLPASPDDTMSLLTVSPSACSPADLFHIKSVMCAGQPFTQSLKTISATGAVNIVKRRIFLFYVPNTQGNGKLYWSERSRRSISSNRCLPLDTITDIYLGHHGEAAPAHQEGGLCFSLLSANIMLDLEAHSCAQLCLWLWGLGSLIFEDNRSINENRDSDSTGVTQQELDSLKKELMDMAAAVDNSGEREKEKERERQQLFELQRKHTRKFSILASHASYIDTESPSQSAAPSAANSPAHAKMHTRSQSRSPATSIVGGVSSVSNVSLQSQLVQGVLTPLNSAKASVANTRAAVEQQLNAMKEAINHTCLEIMKKTRQHVTGVKELRDELIMEQKKRKRLQNKVIEMQGNIRVFCRVRPVNADELASGDHGIIQYPSENMLQITSAGVTKEFEFDRVFDHNSTQADVFKDVAPFVQSSVDGYSVCAFAYGQTGSGKSFTMEGPKHDRGVNYRALAELFELTSGSQKSNGYQYQITVSVLEIYNETLRDLLNADQKTKQKLEIRQGPDGVYVPDLTEIQVNSVAQVTNIMNTQAYPNRAVACTNMNEHSSRSHCVLFVKVNGLNERTDEKTFGRLVLVDLAGSERISKSGAEGSALKEAQAINQSLSALGNVISALSSKSSHVPYRDSKLSHLLSSCLSGQSKCLMFCQLSPAASSHQESMCSLLFATRARNTELGVAKKNKVSGDIAKTQQQMKKAKEESKTMKEDLSKVSQTLRVTQDLVQEKQDIINQLQQQLKEKEKEVAQLKESKATLQVSLIAREKELLVATHALKSSAPRNDPTSKLKSNVRAPLAQAAHTHTHTHTHTHAHERTGSHAWTHESNSDESTLLHADNQENEDPLEQQQFSPRGHKRKDSPTDVEKRAKKRLSDPPVDDGADTESVPIFQSSQLHRSNVVSSNTRAALSSKRSVGVALVSSTSTMSAGPGVQAANSTALMFRNSNRAMQHAPTNKTGSTSTSNSTVTSPITSPKRTFNVPTQKRVENALPTMELDQPNEAQQGTDDSLSMIDLVRKRMEARKKMAKEKTPATARQWKM